MSFEKRQYVQEEEQSMNKAIDLSHHLSDLAKSRQISPLKGLQKYFKPDAIQFAGGERSFSPFSGSRPSIFHRTSSD